jgi:nuclear transport factor 2 (NTF2) superfamily protein
MQSVLEKGDRVRVVGHHRWMAHRDGRIKNVLNRSGNRFIVKFDHDEVGTWHDEDGDPVLQLGEHDLLPIREAPGGREGIFRG